MRSIDNIGMKRVEIGIMKVGIVMGGKSIEKENVIKIIEVERKRKKIGIVGIFGEIIVGGREGFEEMDGVKIKKGS